MKQSARIRGTVRIECSNGEVREGENLVVDSGLFAIAALIAGTSTVKPLFGALGSNSTPPSAGQTALVAEIALSRHAFGLATTEDNEVVILINFVASGVWNVAEIGLFSASVGGTMFARWVFVPVNMAAADTLFVTWRLAVEP